MNRFLLSTAGLLCAVCIAAAAPACAAGDGPDGVVNVADDNEEMNAAMAAARKTIRTFIARVEAPGPGQEGLSLKARFDDNGQTEHIWLGNVSHKDGVFTGVIANEPVQVTNVRPGDRVQVPVPRVSDWMWIENGKLVGGYTIRVMRE
jgi:uncharacterized protein YegJ (DUF2314 family)